MNATSKAVRTPTQSVVHALASTYPTDRQSAIDPEENMSRTSRIAALVAALSITGAGVLVAQSADSTRGPRPRRQMSDSAGAMRGQFPRAFGRGFGAGPGGRGPTRFAGPGGGMLRGITLSESQERALKNIRVKHITTMKPLQVEMIAARADAQIAQLNGDQKALDAANGRLTSARDQMRNLMGERSPTTDLRSVLTPDQQKILDKNLTDGAARRASMMRGMQGMRGMPGMGGRRGGMQQRGFGPGQPNWMPGNGMRPGMGPRRGDDTGAFSDDVRPGDMDELDDVDDMGDFDDDFMGWDDFALFPPAPPAPSAPLVPPAPAPDRRP